MLASSGRHARSGLDVVGFHGVCTRSHYTEWLGDLRINVSLTDAVLALYFIAWGTDASEGPLQILTGTGRTRARKGYTFIGIFKEKQNKNYRIFWTIRGTPPQFGRKMGVPLIVQMLLTWLAGWWGRWWNRVTGGRNRTTFFASIFFFLFSSSKT